MKFNDSQDLLSFLHREREGVLILEPQEEFNPAIIGYDDGSRCLVYSGEILIHIYCRQFGTPLEEAKTSKEEEERYMSALDFMCYNISFGTGTPLIHWEHLHDTMSEVIPEGHFGVHNEEDEIRVLPYIATHLSTQYNKEIPEE